MIQYNPFSKDINELDIDELNKLIENKITEGWYIEYKSRIPLNKQGKLDNLKISKSISSFANTKGGWIFWGIECEQNSASELCGIDIQSYNNFQDRISQIISSNINPKPIFHFKEIKLNKDKIIFVIKVEESPTPPYITSQGIIYQRENNESKPIKERYIIEKLKEKTDNYINSIEDFCHFDDFGETKGQSDSNQSFLELYLFPRPFNHFSFDKFHTSDFFKSVALRFYQNVDCVIQDTTIPLNLGFNSIYSSGDSIIIRPITNDNLIYKSTTVELFRNGNLKFLIPISEFTAMNHPVRYNDSKVLEYLLDKFSPYETKEDYYDDLSYLNLPKPTPRTERSKTDFTSWVKLIDGSEIILYSLIIISKYKAILEDNNFELSTNIGFRARITDVWRKFVFFESEEYLEKLKLYNIPLTPKVDIEVPKFQKANSFNLELDKDNAHLILSYAILSGIGLPDSSDINFYELLKKSIERFKSNTN